MKQVSRFCSKCHGLIGRRHGGWPQMMSNGKECTDCYAARVSDPLYVPDDEDGQALKERVA